MGLIAGCAPDPTDGEPVEGVAGAVHGFAFVDTRRWHWIEAGQGPPLVLVHGMPESAYAWRDQLTAFSSEYRVIAVDLRGFGLSDKADGDFTVGAMARGLARLLDAAGVETMRLVGHDWGGMVAARLAGEHPDRVLAYAHVAAPIDSLDLGRWPDYRDFHDDPTFVAGFLRSPDVFVTRIFESTMVDIGVLAPEELERHIREFGRSGVRQAVGYWFRDLELGEGGTLGASALPGWRAMRFPVAVLVGDRDLQAPLEIYLGAEALIPGYRGLVVIDGAGHYPAEEQPERFNAALARLLETDE